MDVRLAREIRAAMSSKTRIQPSSNPSEAETATTSSVFPSQKPTVQKWLSTLPPKASDFKSASTQLTPTLAHYQDWLHWIETQAMLILTNLDAEERKYRKLGLKYHTVPRTLRLMPTQPDRTPINHTILSRLAEILETSDPRVRQAFFMPWHKASMTATMLLDLVRDAQQATAVESLEPIHRICQGHIRKAVTAIHDMRIAMRGLESMVDVVYRKTPPKSEEGMVADLGERFGREGKLFRAWIGTFPEVVAEDNAKRAMLVNEITRQMWNVGVDMEKGTWWSEQVKDGGLVGEGRVGRLGNEWLRSRVVKKEV